jgi:hypothetical protein
MRQNACFQAVKRKSQDQTSPKEATQYTSLSAVDQKRYKRARQETEKDQKGF